MSKQIFICTGIILFICLIGFIIYTYFEIYPLKKEIVPAKVTLNNNYLALDRWLIKTGHNIRIINNYSDKNIADITERVAVTDSLLFFDLMETENILSWIRKGHFLVICIDYLYSDSCLNEFLDEFGITVMEIEPESAVDYINIPAFDSFHYFILESSDNGYTRFTMEDEKGFIKLVEIQIGDGALTVTGTPYFMQNTNISELKNAELAWMLTGARTDAYNMGILFAREPNWNNVKSFFGAIIERGNLKPVIISSLILIFIGFWMVIPSFGLVSNEKTRNSRPIKDRFTAEIRFLKKYKALDYYLDINEYTNKNKESEY